MTRTGLWDEDSERPTSLSDRLEQPRKLDLPVLQNYTALRRTLERVIEKYDRPSTAAPAKALEYLEKFLKKVLAQDWAKTPLSFVTQVAAFAFSSEFRAVERFRPVREFLLAEVRVSSRAAFLNPMVRVYIESFVLGADHTARLAEALNSARARIGLKWQALLNSVPEFFNPAEVSKKLSARMIGMEEPWHGLRALGLRQPHAPGLMDQVHIDFVRQSSNSLTNALAIRRMLGWLKPDGQVLRRVGAGEAITALLAPWRNKQPPDDIARLLINSLTEFYGHPRASRAAAWNEVEPELERVFMRWLMKSDFRFLFQVLHKVEPSHMFPDREAFWLAMVESGEVDELWVAFKEDGHRVAMSMLPHNQRQSGRRFGMQSGEKDKSLLLMRIGNKIVVEGTHSFKVHIFKASDPRAPKLYQQKYDVSDIRSLPNIDSYAHQGDWQSKTRLRLAK